MVIKTGSNSHCSMNRGPVGVEAECLSLENQKEAIVCFLEPEHSRLLSEESHSTGVGTQLDWYHLKVKSVASLIEERERWTLTEDLNRQT